eukprot:CAMPEP_0175045988 /NCGR_PEP_ID=MMETSP0052_2-20121109/4770_1 /TAXON_ID=51329 ORGANISM="Polytomella parva, Strain SAG 63-3" /NCGR_SAMPLE_ID=MMETSP0052_2 /ASSEMBLY_ACC=CAM_ASM_000194 /LENGTH=198 /DNA_ID=CAMNT_0016309663 /DNA_START=1 /DNA_END=597 /DNA_ORIENTATION=-
MGKDKYENEGLIKYGLPSDVWFHVDNMSSAHVYLRLPDGVDFRSIPESTLEDCAQLVKQNSIQGCKENDVTIVYTPWANLKKTNNMEVGQVGFYKVKEVLKTHVEKKDAVIINRLEKTKKELYPDLAAEKEAYEQNQRLASHAAANEERSALRKAKESQKKAEDLRAYKGIMKEEYMVSNEEMSAKYHTVEDFEDDFM